MKGSKTAKKKPPFQHGNGGSIIEFTHQCRWWLCRDPRTKRNSAVHHGTQKSRSKPYRLTPTRKMKLNSKRFYTENERGDTWRHMTAHKRDKTALIIETQMKLRGVEFHFCPSGEMGQGRAAKSSPFVWFGATSHASHQQQLQSSWRKWLARDVTHLHVCRTIWALFVWNNREWFGANRL